MWLVHRVKAVCQPGDLFKTLLRVPLTSDLNTVRKTAAGGYLAGGLSLSAHS